MVIFVTIVAGHTVILLRGLDSTSLAKVSSEEIEIPFKFLLLLYLNRYHSSSLVSVTSDIDDEMFQNFCCLQC